MPTDVLIIGAGPVGLTAAAELTRYGLSVRIIDQAPERTDKSKALVVWPRTLEHLQRLHLADTFVATGRKATCARFFNRDEELASIKLDTAETPFPFGLMIPQSETERLLTEYLTTHNITVERPIQLTSFTQSEDSITATLTNLNNPSQTETITARWLIAADGAHSTVRHLLNAAFEGETLPSDWVLADVHIDGPIAPDSVELHLHTDGVLALFAMKGDRFRIVANTSHGKSNTNPPDPTLADIQTLLDTRDNRNLRAHDPVWLSAFHINERRVADFRHNNIFLAGDAAHVHSPAGGQGMNTGMQDAINLAWKLALIQKNLVAPSFIPQLLSSYTAERLPVAAKVLKGSGLLTKLGTLDSALLRGARNHFIHLLFGFDTAQHAFAENVTELAVAYPDSPLNATHAHPKGTPAPGDRYPVHAGDAPVSAGNTPRVTLVAAPSHDPTRCLDGVPNHLDPTPRPPIHPGAITLLRPDGYVAFAGDTNAFHQADAYMTHLIYGL
jgi:2-polyprenyl-6-methoxyphenol hydroxylase-like FAD-dependent oxidoreductase